MNFCQFLDAAQLILHLNGNLTILARNKIDWKQIRFIPTGVDSIVSKQNIKGPNVLEKTSVSNSEVVVIKSIEVRDILHLYVLLQELNRLLRQQWKHSKYMYARCLICHCFINYFTALENAPNEYFMQVQPRLLTHCLRWFALIM